MIQEESSSGNMLNKTCLLCGRQLRGRVDKKFCDDYCRNSFNNRLKGVANNFVRNINNALSKNRRILETLLVDNNGNGQARAHKEKLVQLGFQFRFVTHSHTAKNGKTYHYCYDYGYLPLGNDWFLILRKKDEELRI